MAFQVHDAIVVGAGIQGCCAAYELALRGQDTLLLEQFDRLHTRGSSHGASRITRMAYDRYHHAEMMKEAFSMWSDIEAESGQQIFIRTGFLAVDKPGLDGQTVVERILKRGNIPMEVLNNDQLAHRYPMLRCSSNMKGILEEFGGVLLADRARQTLQELFEKKGGLFKSNERVLGVQPGSIITVNTSKAVYRAYKIILTVGPWAKELITSLGVDIPLQLKRISVCYWKVDNPKEWDASQFPTFVDYSGEHHIYGLPILEYPGLFKLCWHDGLTIRSPDQRDTVNDKAAIEVVSQYIREHMTGMSDRPTIVEPCIYTCTPDNDFVLDHHPEHPNIIIGAGFSGHGFKLAPVVGRILAQLATNRQTVYDMTPFKIARFKKEKLKSLL